MIDIKSYFSVATASLCIAYCLYILFFRDELRFRLQRIFILGSIAISVLFPLTQIDIYLPGIKQHRALMTESAPLTNVMAIQNEVTENGLILKFTDYLQYFYIMVSAIFILMMMFNLIRLLRLYVSSEKIRENETMIIRSEKIKSPFSFFKWVFIPENLSSNDELNSIVIHENVHARNLHSLDNLILELLTVFMWFNPFLWMLKRSLHLVHEYLADEGTIQSGIERTRYQALLINHVAEEKLICLHSSFYNNLKQRMIMMTKSKNKDHKSSGMLSMVPVSAILILVIAVMNGFIRDASAAEGNQEQKQKDKKDKSKEIVVTGYGDQKLNNKQGDETMNYIVDGVSVKNIDNIPPDSIESVNVLKTDRTIVIRTKSFARKQVPDSKTTISTGPDKVLYLKDGKPISEEEMRNINPSEITRLDVIKRKESIMEYTDKDFDGVILITTKK